MPVKRCPKCGKGCGPRLKICECGYPFVAGAKKELEKKAQEEAAEQEEQQEEKIVSSSVLGNYGAGFARVWVPGTGMPGVNARKLVPVRPPEEITEKNVREWIEKCQDSAYKYREVYTRHAMKWMTSDCYGQGDTEKRQLLRSLVERIMAEDEAIEEIALIDCSNECQEAVS